jgi:hypothetical protein
MHVRVLLILMSIAWPRRPTIADNLQGLVVQNYDGFHTGGTRGCLLSKTPATRLTISGWLIPQIGSSSSRYESQERWISD